MINENKIREVCSSNRERGFKMLMDSFQMPIYNYIRRLVVSHEDAEDVLQEVFIRVFRHIDQFREESSLSTWMYRIATNESLRLLNSRKDEGVVSAEDVREELMGKLKASDYIDYENELAVKFQEAILSLPEKQRLVFNLRYYDELEYEEIARVLDSKVDTLKVNYHYAKEKIKEYMKKEFDFDDIGKRTPYRTPDGFFEDMQRKVMERAGVKQQRKSPMKLIISTVVAIAAMLTGLLFVPSFYRADDVKPSSSNVLAVERNNATDQVDKWIKELSDEELEELVSFSENDIFLY